MQMKSHGRNTIRCSGLNTMAESLGSAPNALGLSRKEAAQPIGVDHWRGGSAEGQGLWRSFRVERLPPVVV